MWIHYTTVKLSLEYFLHSSPYSKCAHLVAHPETEQKHAHQQLRRPLTTLRTRETVEFAVTSFQIVTSLTNQTSVYLDYTSKYIMNYTFLQYNVDCTPKAYVLRYTPRKCILCYTSEIHCLTCWVIHVGVLCITYHERLLYDTHVGITIQQRASSRLVFCIHCIHGKCYYALHTCCVHNRAKLQFTIYYKGD